VTGADGAGRGTGKVLVAIEERGVVREAIRESRGLFDQVRAAAGPWAVELDLRRGRVVQAKSTSSAGRIGLHSDRKRGAARAETDVFANWISALGSARMWPTDVHGQA